MSPDIQVFVRWKEQTIFAGEDVECTITFKNAASPDSGAGPKGSQKHYKGGSRPVNVIENGAHYAPPSSIMNSFSFSNNRRPASSAGPRTRPGFEKSHRPASSMSSPHGLSQSQSFPPGNAVSNGSGRPSGHKHKRSVSIISLEQPEPTEHKQASASFSPRPRMGHGRSASFQIFSRRNESYGNGINSGM